MRPLRLALLSLCAAAMLALPGRAAAGDCSVMLDVSGSMQGFRTSAEYQRVVSAFDDACDHAFLFGDVMRPVDRPLLSFPMSDSNSRLGDALEDWLEQNAAKPGARLVLITDNVVDDRGAAGRSQADFYALFQSEISPFNTIGVILMRPDFGGRVFALPPLQRVNQYGGPRALSIYVLTLKGGDGTAKAWFNDVQKMLAAAGLKKDDLTPSARGVFAPISLSPFLPRGYESTPPPDGSRIGVGNAGDFVRYSKGQIQVSAGMSDRAFSFRLTMTVRESPDWRFGSTGAPPFVAFISFAPDEFARGGEDVPCKTTRRDGGKVEVTCELSSHWSQLSQADRERLSVEGESRRSGELIVRAEVNRSEVALVGALAEAWDWNGSPDRLADNDPAVQERVYKLGDLMRGMLRERDLEASVGRRIPIEVVYSHNPVPAFEALFRGKGKSLLIAGGLAVLLLLLAGLALHRPKFKVAGSREPDLVRTFGFLQRVELTSRDGRQRLDVWPLGVALLMVGVSGSPRPMMLGLSGGDVTVANKSKSVGPSATFGFRKDLSRRSPGSSPARRTGVRRPGQGGQRR